MPLTTTAAGCARVQRAEIFDFMHLTTAQCNHKVVCLDAIFSIPEHLDELSDHPKFVYWPHPQYTQVFYATNSGCRPDTRTRSKKAVRRQTVTK